MGVSGAHVGSVLSLPMRKRRGVFGMGVCPTRRQVGRVLVFILVQPRNHRSQPLNRLLLLEIARGAGMQAWFREATDLALSP